VKFATRIDEGAFSVHPAGVVHAKPEGFVAEPETSGMPCGLCGGDDRVPDDFDKPKRSAVVLDWPKSTGALSTTREPSIEWFAGPWLHAAARADAHTITLKVRRWMRSAAAPTTGLFFSRTIPPCEV
jgi:hypothetical protein